MKGNRKTDSAVNDEQVVDFVEDSVELAENGEPIPAELLAEPEDAEPEPAKVLEPLPSTIVPEETDLKTVLELPADPRVQYQDNFRIASEDIAGMSLKAAIVGGLCALVHHGVTEQQDSMLPIAAILILSVVVIRFWYLHKRASNLAKTKITLTEEYLMASGPDPRENWKVRISTLEKAMLVSESAQKKSLVVTTSTSSYVLRGLEDPENLMRNLPKVIQVDAAAVPEQKLQEIADSMFDCKDADEVEALRDVKLLQQRVQESLSEEFPDAHVLEQDFSIIAKESITNLVVVGIILITTYLVFPQYALSLIPIAIFAFLPRLLSLRRTVDCLYVFSANALYELDRKSGTVHTISLNRVVNREHDSDSDVSLFIDNRVHLPVRIEKAEGDYIKSCLKKYPSSKTL